MLRAKIRTLGFALLGNNRTDDGAAPPTTAEDEAKRIGAGGWGRGQGDVEVDSELEELIRSDHPSSPVSERPTAPTRPSSGASKYHTVGSTSSPSASYEMPVQAEELGNGVDSVGVDSEGYYELCIKSVEAVNWDPESEGPDSSAI